MALGDFFDFTKLYGKVFDICARQGIDAKISHYGKSTAEGSILQCDPLITLLAIRRCTRWCTAAPDTPLSLAISR